MTMYRKDGDDFGAIATEIHSLKDHIHPPVPNPAPLGLIAFGVTVTLLQVKHTRLGGSESADLKGVDAVVMGFAMFFGGLLQIIAGCSEIRRNNIFGYTAFNLYGGFWMSFGTMMIVSLLATGGPPHINPKAIQALLFLVGLFSAMLWVLTFKLNKTICLIFGLLVVTCFCLSWGVQNPTVDKVGGWFGIATSAMAFWLAFVELVNDVIGEGKEIIPVFHWKHNGDKIAGGLHAPGRITGRQASMMRIRQASMMHLPNMRRRSTVPPVSPPLTKEPSVPETALKQQQEGEETV